MSDQRFTKKSFIGSGGMATVYRAYDTLFAHDVAIKEIVEAHRGDELIREMFLEEARKMRKVEDKHVVKVYEIMGASEIPTIIEEFMADGDLASRLGDSGLKTDEALEILEQVLMGLRAIHKAGLVHRDIKPDNVLAHEGVWKITDFGVAMTGQEEALHFVASKYAAPEVLLDPNSIGAKTDLYSLGIMAVEMLLGPERFQAAVKEAMASQDGLNVPASRAGEQAFWQQWIASSVELPPVNTIDDSLSEDVAEYLSGLCRRSIEERPTDCDVALHDLRRLRESERNRRGALTEEDPRMKKQREKHESKPTPDPEPDSGKANKPRWGRRLGVAAVVVVALLITTFMLLPGDSRVRIDLVSNPPGADVRVNGVLMEGWPTPTWYKGNWGDSVTFEMEGMLPAGVVVAEGVDGLTIGEEGLMLEVSLAPALSITTSAEAEAYLRDKLPSNWSLDLSLDGIDPADELHTVEVGTPLNFKVESERAGKLMMLHLGSDDAVTLVYPAPDGSSLQLVEKQPLAVGGELNLEAAEPLGNEWFVFIVAADLPPVPAINGGQRVGQWARRYQFSLGDSPGQELVYWLADALDAETASASILATEVVYRVASR
jgi:serine/threonine protein kinase